MAHEISQRDTYRWQLRAGHALVEMLEHGADTGLPTIQWIIAHGSGALVGEVPGLLSTPDQQRAAFDAWADYLGAERWDERVTKDGVVSLHAQFAWAKDPLVKGAIRAKIFPESDS